jgi:lipoate synthase
MPTPITLRHGYGRWPSSSRCTPSYRDDQCVRPILTRRITITQYLRPTPRHHPIERWVTPAEFEELDGIAREIGFVGVMSGPLVRSSYRAGALYAQARSRQF